MKIPISSLSSLKIRIPSCLRNTCIFFNNSITGLGGLHKHAIKPNQMQLYLDQ